ncbi:putative O-linked N-acetylglucosamine transferase (SPINDLY family) [Variovorax boronicumulans]|uniref:tetratricopeptide repeat protein n=1 Tax=Variovorax boronicumulans TaxID=436515 RepID=UPI00277E82FF|nr:glycosyltransferase family 41 protein [Variovorax boronicumulans]MDP9920475.1 putative O-linked N-acetylglucosamine transferase (SPINDLY family) [Variovorax boronicumulans]
MPQSTNQKIALADRYFQAGQIRLCEDLLRQVIARNKAISKAYELLAYICGNRDELEACEELLLKASSLPGCSAEALFYLGRVQLQRGQARAALSSFQRAIARGGGFFEAWHEMGVAHSTLGGHEQALEAFRRALEIHAGSPELHVNLARTMAELHYFDEAIRHCDLALALDPERVRAWVERGLVLTELGRRPEALRSCEQALALAPDDSAALMTRAMILARLGRHAEAEAVHEEIARLPPDTTYGRGHWLYNSMLMCRWSGWERTVADTLARVSAGEKAAVPFSLLATPACPATLLACARTYAQDRYPLRNGTEGFASCPSKQKLRVGYFSSDFRNHATSQLMVRLFECHDRQRFELFGFTFGPATADPMTRRVAAAFDRFMDVADRSDAQIASLARAEGIDIAVDLNGFTEGARPSIFAHRAAPVQVNYLGFPASMGCEFMDYIVADATLIRPDEYNHYAEKVVILPGSYQANDDTKVIGDATLTREDMDLPPHGVVFACFNNNYKITPDVFEVWMRLLRQVTGSVLWLLRGSDAAVAGIEAEAKTHGIDPGRIVWAERLPLAAHLARHAHADLFLDTFHYNAHTTCSDALWTGLPVLTLAGRTFASRVAASLLKTIGLPELVTGSVEEYEAVALSLATSPEKLAALRRRLHRNRTETPLFDTPLFTRRIEAAFAAMWDRHRLGLPPDHIHVAAS